VLRYFGVDPATVARCSERCSASGAYVLLLATYHDDLGYLSNVPFAFLALAVVGVPLAAAAAGSLLAGREPRGMTRTALF
jgi:hypothetical protein